MDIFNLPCVISLEKALADKSTFFYIILSVDHKRVAVPGDWVCEDENGEIVKLETAILPDGIREGDLFLMTEDKTEILPDETAEKKKRMADLQKSIFTKK